VTRWPARKRPEVVAEPPARLRSFDPEDWATPDAHEVELHGPGGATDPGWREWHAWRRWAEAVRGWYAEHPQHSFLDDLLARRDARRAGADMD
jgi:hypothetical protein